MFCTDNIVLKQQGYDKISISFKFDAYEKNDGYQYVFLYDGTSESSTLLYEQEFEHVPGSQSSTVKTYSFYTIIDLDDISTNYIYIRYGASGSGSDTWYNSNLKINIVAS